MLKEKFRNISHIDMYFKNLEPRAKICATYVNEFTCVYTLTATWDSLTKLS